MRFGILLASALSALAVTAVSAQDMNGLFANTVTMTHADGSVTRVHFKDGGTYDFVTASGVAGGGTWAMKDGQFCTTRTTPAPQPEQCRPWSERKVGDKWEEDTPMGHVAYEVVAGQ